MIISNSMIQDLQVCEMRFYYAQQLVIRPNEYPDSLERGITGHTMFEAFFLAMQEGKPYEECVQAINPIVIEIMKNPELMKAYRLVLAFGAYAFTQPWEVVFVEKSFFHPVGDNEFAFKPDIILRWTATPKKGNLFILDFKFTGQYWTEGEVKVSQQLPKYVRYFNKLPLGLESAKNAALVMLNTRAAQGATGNKLFLIKWVPLGKKKLNRIEFENKVMMDRVREIKERNGDDQDKYMRTVNTFACKRCFFLDLCNADLEGQDTTKRRAKLYRHNDYFDNSYGDLP